MANASRPFVLCETRVHLVLTQSLRRPSGRVNLSVHLKHKELAAIPVTMRMCFASCQARTCKPCSSGYLLYQALVARYFQCDIVELSSKHCASVLDEGEKSISSTTRTLSKLRTSLAVEFRSKCLSATTSLCLRHMKRAAKVRCPIGTHGTAY